MNDSPLPPVDLSAAIAAVPGGRWGVAVSGGADSVALLRLLRERNLRRDDLHLQVLHLDHETRGGQSGEDAAFVVKLAQSLGIGCTTAKRSIVEASLAEIPANPSARYRAARLEFFAGTVGSENLAGVILAHHADDQAETVFLRLLKAGNPGGLAGISPRARVGGLTILRPLLKLPRSALRQYLRDIGQEWREDASNQSPKYLRNRVRALLAKCPELRGALLEMGQAFGNLRNWVRGASPTLAREFAARRLADLPDLLAREAARRWLVTQGSHPRDLSLSVLDRLVAMARDAASPPREQFPGGLRVRRRRGKIFADPEPSND